MQKMIEPPPAEIWYCYGDFQPIFSPDVKFHEGMPSFTKFDDRRSTFLIMDVMDMASCRPMGASVARLVILISGARSRSWN